MENNTQRNKGKEYSLSECVQLHFTQCHVLGKPAKFWLHRAPGAHQELPELPDLPLISQEGGTKAPHGFVAAFPVPDTHTGEGEPCQEPAAAASVCCKRKHVCSCMCVCMDREAG